VNALSWQILETSNLGYYTVTTSYDEGDNDKDVGDSDEELVPAAEHDFKHQA
jgi:hypothetical protein